MKKAIVTFCNGADRYVREQLRQKMFLDNVGYDGSYYCYRDFAEIGSPTHAGVPYAFKPCAIQRVIEMGYTHILWMDAPVYPVKPLDALFEEIGKRELVLFDNIGYSIGDYTSDQCLSIFGIEREESFKMKMIMACCMGIKIHSPLGKAFFEPYYDYHRVRGAYEGDWTNQQHQVSSDRRVRGHRHDQSVASIVAHRMGVELLIGHETFFTYYGNPGMMPVADSVCLYSQGT